MKKIFWLVKEGKRTGPLREDDLQSKIDAGEVSANDLVFYPGSKGLERIGQLEEFQFGNGNSNGGGDGREPAPAEPAPAQQSPAPTPQAAAPQQPVKSPVKSPAPQASAVRKSPPPPKPRLPQPREDAEKRDDGQRRPSTRILSRRELEKESERLEEKLDAVKSRGSDGSQTAGDDSDDPPPIPEEARVRKLPDTDENKVTTRIPKSPSSEDNRMVRPTPFRKKPAPPTELSAHQFQDQDSGAQQAKPEVEIDFSFAEGAYEDDGDGSQSSEIREEDHKEEHQPEQKGLQRRMKTPAPSAEEVKPPEQTSHTVKPRPGSQSPKDGDVYGMQTVIVGESARKPRRDQDPERQDTGKEADKQYPDVIKSALRTEPGEEEAQEQQKEDILPEQRSMQLQASIKSRKPRNAIKPEFENSLGMGFVAVEGLPLGVAIWPVRVKDYRQFVQDSEYDAGDKWKNPDFMQLGENPVTFVSYEDAEAFCLWLTQKERQEGWIDDQQCYRLPSDHEWSHAAGLKETGHKYPAQLHAKIADHYPWGNEWPPPKGVGNYADESAAKKFGWDNVAPGYDDGYVYTSPVGAFPPNRNKIYDMGGNVWEWVQDWFDQDETARALRGGSWTTNQPEMLLTSARDSAPPDARRGKNGFRLVLAVE